MKVLRNLIALAIVMLGLVKPAYAQDEPKTPIDLGKVVNDLTSKDVNTLADTMWLGSSTTRWMLRNPQITDSENSPMRYKEELNLVLVSLQDIGLDGNGTNDEAMDWPTYEQILRFAAARGYKACPAWVGPKLLLDNRLDTGMYVVVANKVMSDGEYGYAWSIYRGQIGTTQIFHEWKDGTLYYEQYKFPFDMEGEKYYFVFTKPSTDTLP